MNRRAQLICICCGPVLMVLFAIGWVGLGRFLPPWVGARDSPAQTARIFWDHADRIRIGVVFTILSMGMLAPWGSALAAQTRRREGRFPVLAYAQVTCIGAATAMILAACVFWGVATYRPHAVSPQLVQLCHDVGWFFFLYTWPAFSLWAAFVGLAILLDQVEYGVYPRWAGYLSIFVALDIAPGGIIIFFKHGAFSWSGAIALYVPVGAFFIWLVAMTTLTLKNIQKGLHEEAAASLDSAIGDST
ncbi:MAG TPA: hypothetical protein VHX88_07270 [Solirubrobacteraceae bacterium]|jgi:hypothetical protein|nr:hypothetical protein [Solirubrobacteraceae bacterium]